MRKTRGAASVGLGSGSLASVLLGWGSLASALFGCADLPVWEADVCGNGVVESGEDCDRFVSDPAYACRAPAALGACHFDCSPSADAERAQCPPGFGCDAQGLCRAPTGAFLPAVRHTVAAKALAAGDFDGDGRMEVVSRPEPDALDRSPVAFHYFDAEGDLEETRSFPKLLGSPRLLDLSGDGRSDLIFTDFRVGLLLGREDRGLVPETFSSLRFEGSAVRVVGVYDDLIQDSSSLLVLCAIAGRPGLYVPDEASVRLRSLGDLPGAIEDAVGDPAGGPIFDADASPCDEVVLAMREESSFFVFELCERASDTGAVQWRDQAERREIELEPEAPIDAPPVIADVDGDGHLDVLIGAGGEAYVAFGDGTTLGAAEPYQLSLIYDRQTFTRSQAPLAAADLNGDGFADYIFDDLLVVSMPRKDADTPQYLATQENLGAPWTVARFGDLNGNGKLDVVAASSGGAGIDFFNGTGEQYQIASRLPTAEPVTQLAIGDFDGDLTNDLAFVEGAVASDKDSLAIAFGSLGRPLAEARAIGRLRGPEELCAYRELGQGNLVVAASQEAEAQVGTLTLLDGSADRIPFAPATLASFTDDGLLPGAPALAVLGGAFRGGDPVDVLVLAANEEVQDFHFWLLPDFEQGQSAPLRLAEGSLDPSLTPVLGETSARRFRAAGAAADLDGDGRDEAVWAMPSDGGSHCGLISAGVEVDADQSAARLLPRGSLMLEAPCADPVLATLDADGDGALDLLLLSGARDDAERGLTLYWNDGTGGFSEGDSSRLNGDGESPSAFAVLPAIPARPLSVVYVTTEAARMRRSLAGERLFDDATTLTELSAGSAVVAADINGDAATDLVFADAGSLVVLLGELVPL